MAAFASNIANKQAGQQAQNSGGTSSDNTGGYAGAAIGSAGGGFVAGPVGMAAGGAVGWDMGSSHGGPSEAQIQAYRQRQSNLVNNAPTYTPDASQPWNNQTFEQAYTPGKTAVNGGFGSLTLEHGPQGLGWYRSKTSAQSALEAQQYYTNQFKQNMPTLANQMTSQLGGQINQGMNQGIQNTRQADSRRGLLYGGINQGREGKIQASAAGQMAQGRSDINSGLMNAEQSMTNNTISSGFQWQQQMQSMQNDIYQNALASMMKEQGALSGTLGAAGAIVGGYFGGAAGAGAGYAGGQSAGKAIY